MPVPDSEFAQLRWRCRRGMLELDLLLNGYLDLDKDALTAEQLRQLEALLEYPDQVLLELLTGTLHSVDDDINQVVARIRAANERRNRRYITGASESAR